MSVDQDTVRRIGKLARIKIEDADVPRLENELNSILKWIEMLEEVDTSDVKPLTSIGDAVTRQREDKVADGGYPEKIVANAPASEDNFFMVPKVVE